MNKALLAALVFLFAFFGSIFIVTPIYAQYECRDPGDPACEDGWDTTDPDLDPNVAKEIQDINRGRAEAASKGVLNFADFKDKDLRLGLGALSCVMGGSEAGCPDPYVPGRATPTRSGVMGTAVDLIAGMYRNPPANTATYLASVKNDLRLGSPVYAQGLGFSALSPILSIWTTLRNVAYFFFIIAFIVIGFMIMFRQKISGQAVVTAQQAIPSIIIALLTVTFSYAIAGLLIDGMYLIMFLIAGLFGKIDLISGNVFQMAVRLIGGGAAVAGASALGDVVSAALGQGIIGEIGRFITNIGATVIILLVIVFNTFRLFFSLLRVYIELILNIAFAPAILMTGAIPGQNPFGRWIKDIIGNLAVFPAILLILVMYDVIRDSVSGASGGFLPPYVTGFTDPAAIPLLAGTALILALPNVVDETRKAFGVSQQGFFGNLIQAGVKNAESGVQYAPPVVLGGYGLGKGVVEGIDQARLGKGNVFESIYKRSRYNLAEQVPRGNEWARRIANLREGKLLDPNSWENALLALQRDQLKKTRDQKNQSLDSEKPAEAA